MIDDQISDSVSLSDILDVFIQEDEKPTVILNFLKKYDTSSSFSTIIENSIYWKRIFQLDFFLKCNCNEQQYILNIAKLIDPNVCSFFYWQLCASTSRIKSIDLTNIRNYVIDNDKRQNHPHSTFIGKSARTYDIDILRNFKEYNDNAYVISDYLNSLSLSDFERFFKYLSNSLFKYRILQSDIYSRLDNDTKTGIAKKLVFLKTISTYYYSDYENFGIQLMLSSEDIEEIKYLFDIISSKRPIHDYSSSVNDYIPLRLFLDECDSADELILKLAIDGKSISTKRLLFMTLQLKKFDFARAILEYDDDIGSSTQMMKYLDKYEVKRHRRTAIAT